MAYIECDTEKMRENGTKIQNLASELNEIINEYYKRIENMPTVTGEWIGDSAEKFVSYVISSKRSTVNFCNSLNSYGKYFVDSAEAIERTTKNNIQ